MRTGTALANSTDVTTLVTRTDLKRAMGLLSSLPSQVAAAPELQFEASWIAIEGVTRHALLQATKAILRGETGRGFFPSPADLRKACNAAQMIVDQATENDRLRSAIAAQRAAFEEHQKGIEAGRDRRFAERMERLRETAKNHQAYEDAVAAAHDKRAASSAVVDAVREKMKARQKDGIDA